MGVESTPLQPPAPRIRSTGRKIAGAAILVGICAVFVRALSLIKEVLVAHRFGTGAAYDAFTVAFTVAQFAITVVAGSFTSSLVPVFIDVRERDGKAAAVQMFAGVMFWGSALLVAVSVSLALVFPFTLPVLASSFDPEKRALTVRTFVMLLPLVLLSGWATIWGAVLNAGEKFAVAALVPLASPGAIIVLVALYGTSTSPLVLVAGCVVGALVEAAVLGWAIRGAGLTVRAIKVQADANVRKVFRQYGSVAAGSTMHSATALIDQSMAATLAAGSVAALSYGSKLVSMVYGILSVAVGTAVIPYFSRMVSRGDWDELERTVKRCLVVIAVTTSVLVVAFASTSPTVVRIMFQHGAFKASDTALVARIQACAAVQIPFYVAGILVVRLISSLHANHILMQVAAVNFVSNVVLDYCFMKWLGAAGIALSTAFVYALSLALCWIALRKRIALVRAGSLNLLPGEPELNAPQVV